MSNPKHLSLPLKAGILALSAAAMLLSGCALQTTASGGNAFVADAVLSGRVHGGNQPIVGATVNLYAVGTTGYGSGATLLATTTSTGSGGSFSFTQSALKTGPDNPVDASYGCPSSSSLLYITTGSGDPTGIGTPANYNTHIKFVDAIGACGSVATSFFDINEVSTVVTVAALQQYMNPVTEGIGAPSTTPAGSRMARAATGIANAFALVPLMLSQTTGQVNATYPLISAVGSVTATPEAAKINTMADILAACVNTAGSTSQQCATLFAAATPPVYPTTTNFPTAYGTSPTATDTVQVALFMLQNPADAGTQVSSCYFGSATSNLSCLYNAQTAAAPFIGLSAAPNDWTVGITYGSNSVNTTTDYLISDPEYIAVDAQGDIWMVNYASGTATSGNSLVELSPVGVPMVQTLATSLTGPSSIAIDPAGNVWVPNFGVSAGLATTLSEYTASGLTTAYTVSPGPEELTIDGAGNVFSLSPSYKGAGALQEILAGSSTVTTLASGFTTNYSYLAADANFNIWMSGGGAGALGGTSGYPAIYYFPYAAASPHYSSSTEFTFVSSANLTAPEGLTIDRNQNVWTFNFGKGTLAEISPSFSEVGEGYANSALTKPEILTPDGGGNVWVTNASTTAGGIYQFANTSTINGLSVSPPLGLIHTYAEPYGIAVDPSGNIWCGNYAAKATATVQGFVTEIVGAAVPIVTPLAAGLPGTVGGTNFYATPPQ